MDSSLCRFCNRRFSSNSNRHRHESQFHSKEIDKNNCNMDENNEEQEAEDTDSDSQNHWPTLIQEICEKMDLQTEISEATEVLVEPLLTEFLEELRENLEKRIKFVDYMKEEDKTYQEIQSTADQYNGLDEDEAFEKAWNDRKYLLKRLIREHIEVIENVLENNNEEGDEDEDENETDTY